MEKSTIQVLMLIALLLLVIASINFINLETAQGSRRAKEVGVRKVMGASKGTLIRRFLTESFILCLTSVVVSVGLALVAVEYFSDYIPEGVVLDIKDPMIATFLATCVIVVTLLAGLYPAFIMSSYLPALALKNQAGANRSQTRAALVRQGLTVFQFCFAQILIVGTIAIAMQINFMVNKDLGFSTAVLYVQTPWMQKASKRILFRNELQRVPEVQSLSAHEDPPLSGSWSSTIMKFDNGKDVLEHNVYVKRGDTTYLRVYGIELLAGRNLTPVDTMQEYLINEKYMLLLGFDQPHDALGKTVHEKYTIVGVVKDFHTRSLHNEITPTVIRYESNGAAVGMKIVAAQNTVANLRPAIAKIEAAWKKAYPDEDFKYTFMDDTIADFYATEQRVSSLTRVATAIAILISCLGLFGLSSFTVVQRTKEIGVRKVLGASVNSITFLLSRQFLKLVIIAWAMSTPVAYYLIRQWLGNFAYRIDITASIFLASGLASTLIAFVTISIRTLKAAKSDPVKSLRYE